MKVRLKKHVRDKWWVINLIMMQLVIRLVSDRPIHVQKPQRHALTIYANKAQRQLDLEVVPCPLVEFQLNWKYF